MELIILKYSVCGAHFHFLFSISLWGMCINFSFAHRVPLLVWVVCNTLLRNCPVPSLDTKAWGGERRFQILFPMPVSWLGIPSSEKYVRWEMLIGKLLEYITLIFRRSAKAASNSTSFFLPFPKAGFRSPYLIKVKLVMSKSLPGYLGPHKVDTAYPEYCYMWDSLS